jgi:hypothetical protein
VRIDRSHLPWALVIGALSLIAGFLFVANFYPQSLPFPFRLPERWFGEIPPVRRTFGATPLGIVYGSLAFLIFVFASALGIRKKRRLWRIGNVQTWLKAHIWLTLFTIPLVLFHCGFHWGGKHTTVLLVLYIIVMASGIFGLVLQHFMPRIMKERLSREVVFEQIPHIEGLLFEAALKLRQEIRIAERTAGEPVAAVATAGAGGAAVAPAPARSAADDASLQVIADFLDQEGLPYLNRKRRGRPRLADTKTSDDIFRLLKLNVSDKWKPRVDDLQIWCDDRRMMDLQLRLHHYLHGWLVIHVPFSFALLLFTAWHAWIALRYLITLPAS